MLKITINLGDIHMLSMWFKLIEWLLGGFIVEIKLLQLWLWEVWLEGYSDAYGDIIRWITPFKWASFVLNRCNIFFRRTKLPSWAHFVYDRFIETDSVEEINVWFLVLTHPHTHTKTDTKKEKCTDYLFNI